MKKGGEGEEVFVEDEDEEIYDLEGGKRKNRKHKSRRNKKSKSHRRTRRHRRRTHKR